MAKDDGQSNQLNLTVVALVALVAIVGLVALVLNTAGLAKVATGSGVVSAQTASADANVAGGVIQNPVDGTYPPSGGACAGTAYCRCIGNGGGEACNGWCGACSGGNAGRCSTCLY